MTNREIPAGFLPACLDDEIYVNKKGDVYNHRTGHISTAHSYGAVTVHSYSIKGVERSFHLARAVAMNFLPIPEAMSTTPVTMLNIRHKDGNKRNCCVENLQWEYGHKFKPIKVKTAEGKEYIYSSIEDAWKKHGPSSYRAFCAAVKKGFLRKEGLQFSLIGAQ